MRFAQNTIADIGAQSDIFELGDKMNVERSSRDGKLGRSGSAGSLLAILIKSIRSAAMRKSSCLVVLGGFLVLLGASQNASATNYFNWGVEGSKVSYGVNGPGIYDVQYFNGTTRDCTVSHSGSCSMKIPVIGQDGGNQQRGADLIQWNPAYPTNLIGGPSIYYRAWLRYSVGFNWGSQGVANVKTERGFLNQSQNRLITGHMRSDGFLVAECEFVSGVGGGCLTTGGVPNNDYNIKIPYNVQGKADGLWHEYIIRIKPNTTATTMDAEFQVWVDGVSIGQLNGWRFATTSGVTWADAWGGWMVTPYFQMNGDSSVGGTVWVDDFSTDDVFNSLIGGGGGTAALSPPTNLRVQ